MKNPLWLHDVISGGMALLGAGVIFAGLIILSSTRAAQRRRQAAAEDNRCHKCDYDLTGNTSRRCPECGQAIEG